LIEILENEAGSAGDPNAPQLIIDLRAVTIEYARDDRKGNAGKKGEFPGARGVREEKKPRTDWLCEVTTKFWFNIFTSYCFSVVARILLEDTNASSVANSVMSPLYLLQYLVLRMPFQIRFGIYNRL